jgi:hypothetical protein
MSGCPHIVWDGRGEANAGRILTEAVAILLQLLQQKSW